MGNSDQEKARMLDRPDFGVAVHWDVKIPTNASTTNISSTVVINP